MLIRILIEKSDKEIFSYESKRVFEKVIDTQIISGIFDAVKHSSIFSNEKIERIQFYNMILYFKSYDHFRILLLLDEVVQDKEIEEYFNQLAKLIYSSIATSPPDSSILKQESFHLKIKKILAPLLQTSVSKLSSTLQGVGEQDTVPKIILVGLSQAGKSSIKFRFFEGWSEQLAKPTQPTVGVDYSQIFQEFLLHKFLVMDLGGQSQYRELYLQQKELWERISAFIFVIDIQDSDSFEAAKKYLEDTWGLATRLNERKPRLSLFLHKHDPNLRDKLSQNLGKCLEIFRDFLDVSNIYFTSVEDSSSNIALIKALYVSLPDIVLLRLFKKEFIQHFEHVILPQFSSIATRLSNENFLSIFQEIKEDIRQNAVKLGVAYESTFQKSWLDYLTGELTQLDNEIPPDIMIIEKQDTTLTISLKAWTHLGYPEDLTTLLLDGILEGILKTMQLSPPELVRKNGYTTWRITFDEKNP